MDANLKKLIDAATNHLMMAARLETLMTECKKEEIFEYIAEAGNREFEKVFSMNEFQFLVEIARQEQEITEHIDKIKKGE